MADGFVPPQQVRANAKRGLELRKKHNRGGTEVGVARARDLSNGAALSLDTIKRMNSYFARHEVDKKGEGWGVDSAGYIAWLLWGGDAGWSWARGILRQQESKEKSTVNDLTTSYFSIEKADRQPDGTLMVYGKATDDSVDIDQQICDAAWLDRAMPAWFKSGGNIREQHSSIAAGVAKEYEAKADGHYIMAHVVDPVSVKKVDAGVLRGFSIGIKSPRVVRDTKAANGRIIDGQIVEVSLVDRPANPNCQLVLAKSVDGESSLVQVEELTEEIVKHPGHDQSAHGRGGGRAGAGAGAASGGASGDGEGSGKIMRGGAGTANRAHQGRVSELASDRSAQGSKAQPKLKEAQGHIKEAINRDGTPASVKSHLKDATRSLDDATSTFKAEGNDFMAGATAKVSAGIKRTISQLPDGNDWEGKGAEADIVKHPGHDQSSHGRGGGGAGAGAGAAGAAGGGGGGSAGGEGGSAGGKQGGKTSKAKAKKDLDDAENSLDEGYKDIVRGAGSSPSSNSRVMDAGQMREDAFNHLSDARANITRGNSARAVESLNNAASVLKGEPKFKPAASKIKDLANNIKANPIGKANDAELRKALQSALQLLSLTKSEETSMKDTVELPVEAIGDLLKFDKTQYEAAREALANLIQIEAGEMREGHNEIQSIGHLLEAVMHLHAWYEGEEAEGEVVEEETIIERAADAEETDKKNKLCKECSKSYKMCKCEGGFKAAEDDEDKEEVEAEKSAEISKCLECGCNQPGTDHGLTTTNDFANVAKPSHVTTAEMYAPGETPKSAEGEEPEAVDQELPTEEVKEISADVDPTEVEAIVEQVVKSATQSLKSEIAELVAAKEAALSKAVGLEAELELAKSLAVAGGPSRTAKPINVKTTNDLLTKAAIYKAKANATTDPTLAKGYKALAEKFATAAEAEDK